jgi:hypothetical protein
MNTSMFWVMVAVIALSFLAGYKYSEARVSKRLKRYKSY